MLVAPFLSKLLNVPGLIPKILLTIIGVLVANTFATYSFASLGESWYEVGKVDGKGELPTRR